MDEEITERMEAKEYYELIYVEEVDKKGGLDDESWGIFQVSGWEWLAREYLSTKTSLALGAGGAEDIRHNRELARLIEEDYPNLREPSPEEMKAYEESDRKAADLSQNGFRRAWYSHCMMDFAMAMKLWKEDPRKK